jgi:ribose transport system permease protein
MIGLLIYLATKGRLVTFASADSVMPLARAVGLQAILAMGVLLVILTGGIDLSLGSLVAFSGMLLAITMTRLADAGMPIDQAIMLGVLAVLVISLLLGVIHASLVHLLRLPPFVVTLASMSMLRSGANLMNNQVPIPIERFKLLGFLGNGQVYIAGSKYGIPVTTIIMLLLAAALIAVLGFTRMGRHVYSLGSNEEATRLSGVSVFKVKLFVYGICSLLGGLGGILYAGYAGQGDPGAGQMMELTAISAAVIGGALLTGGRGSALGAILGAALLEMILSIINLTLDNPTLWSGLVVGGVLLIAVIVNYLRERGLFGWALQKLRLVLRVLRRLGAGGDAGTEG